MGFKREYITGGRDFSSLSKIPDDRMLQKNTVKAILLGDSDVIHYLNNKDYSEEDDPEVYFRDNILDYLYISPNPYRSTHVQDIVKNFICYDIDDVDTSYNKTRIHNQSMKEQILTIMIIVHRNDIVTEDGYNRLDLLSFIIDDLFSWSNAFNMRLKKYANVFESYDSIYYTRTLKFYMEVPNSISRGGTANVYERLK